MAGTVIHTIPDTMITKYYPTERAAVSTWLSFRGGKVQEAITTSIPAAAKAGAKALIVDVSNNVGVLSTSDMQFTTTTGAALVDSHNFAALVNVVGTDALTRIGSRKWKQSASSGGRPTYECSTVEDALAIAREIAADRVPQAA